MTDSPVTFRVGGNIVRTSVNNQVNKSVNKLVEICASYMK